MLLPRDFDLQEFRCGLASLGGHVIAGRIDLEAQSTEGRDGGARLQGAVAILVAGQQLAEGRDGGARFQDG